MHKPYAFVNQVATSLNSTECFVLQSGSSVFSWHGNQSTFDQQQLAAKVAEFLKVRSHIYIYIYIYILMDTSFLCM